MPSPFPGMDPYLEDAELWPDVHHRLAVALAELLEPPLRGRYRVFVERRMYARAPEGTPEGTQGKLGWGRPDICVAEEEQQAPYAATPAATVDAAGPLRVRLPAAELESEPFLEIRDAPSGRVVTVVEILSPSNKTPGDGRRAYLDKRAVLFGAGVNLVEIDLLRGGEPMPVWPAVQPGAYGILVSRASSFRRQSFTDLPYASLSRRFGFPCGPATRSRPSPSGPPWIERTTGPAIASASTTTHRRLRRRFRPPIPRGFVPG